MELTLPLRGKIKGKINGIELKFLEIPCFEFAPFGHKSREFTWFVHRHRRRHRDHHHYNYYAYYHAYDYAIIIIL